MTFGKRKKKKDEKQKPDYIQAYEFHLELAFKYTYSLEKVGTGDWLDKTQFNIRTFTFMCVQP